MQLFVTIVLLSQYWIIGEVTERLLILRQLQFVVVSTGVADAATFEKSPFSKITEGIFPEPGVLHHSLSDSQVSTNLTSAVTGLY